MAYKRSRNKMKKLLLFSFFLSCLSGFAQDSEGYFDITQKDNGKTIRFIQSPDRDIQNTMTGNIETKKYVAYYNNLSSTKNSKGAKQIQYKLGFLIMDIFDFDIPKNSRLLIKFKNGQTMTLTTNTNNTSSLKYIDGLKRYYTSASYIITTQQLNRIINLGVSKIRIETQVRNIDVEPKVDFSELTKEFKVALYDRLNNKKDSFTDGF